MSTPLLTDHEVADLEEIVRLLDEAYKHYFDNSDGYCKSAEGHVSVDFGNYFERRDGQREREVQVYSYVLGPSRSHQFTSTREALKEVRKWHKEEMATDHQALEKEMWDSMEAYEVHLTPLPKIDLSENKE